MRVFSVRACRAANTLVLLERAQHTHQKDSNQPRPECPKRKRKLFTGRPKPREGGQERAWAGRGVTVTPQGGRAPVWRPFLNILFLVLLFFDCTTRQALVRTHGRCSRLAHSLPYPTENPAASIWTAQPPARPVPIQRCAARYARALVRPVLGWASAV